MLEYKDETFISELADKPIPHLGVIAGKGR